jgi:glutamyl-tRNA synthetase
MVRVRFAPSPTGFVHLGSLRTALYNYLFAKKQGGTFVLRIEDTDRSRYVEGAIENLISSLNWAGLVPDEGPEQGGEFGPYFQSERTHIYIEYAKKLVDQGLAYYAFDTAEEIQTMRENAKAAGEPPPRYGASMRLKMRNSFSLTSDKVKELLDAGEPHVIRLAIPEDRNFEIDDVVRGRVTIHSSQIDDQVLIKSDGFPTYHLANVVDDHLMQITHVIRGEEWLSSVPKHLYLYECFDWTPPVMAHLPLIFNPDGSKMSKRDITSLDELPQGKVDPDIQTYINEGFERQALINYISLLGWSAGDDREIFSMEELTKSFSLERVNKSAAIFDLQKLNFVNKEHLCNLESAKLAAELKPDLLAAGIEPESDDYLVRVVELLQSRLHFRKDFIEFSRYFFYPPVEYDAKVIKKRWKADSEKLILEFITEISKLTSFKVEDIESALRNVAETNQAGSGRIIHPVRLAVSGVGVGPGLFEMLQVLGKENVIARLEAAVKKIPTLQI